MPERSNDIRKGSEEELSAYVENWNPVDYTPNDVYRERDRRAQMKQFRLMQLQAWVSLCLAILGTAVAVLAFFRDS